MLIRHGVVDTDLGPITLVAEDEAVAGLYFRQHIRRPAQEAFGPEVTTSSDPLLGEAARQLRDYLAGERTEFDLPLAADGDPFQHAVWDVVAHIPRGTDQAPHPGIQGARAVGRGGRAPGQATPGRRLPVRGGAGYAEIAEILGDHGRRGANEPLRAASRTSAEPIRARSRKRHHHDRHPTR